MRMGDYTQKVQEEVASGEIVPSETLQVAQQRRSEQETIGMLAKNASRAVEIEGELLERLSKVQSIDLLPRALSAVSDMRSKSIDGLLKLTGRTPEAPAQGLAEMLRSMADKGYLRVNVELGPPGESGDEPGT